MALESLSWLSLATSLTIGNIVKIDSSFRSWSKLTPQGSVLRSLLLNMYLNDLFFALSDIEVCNFAEENSAIAFTWFETNYVVIN